MAGADQVGRALLSPYQQEGRQCSVSIGNHVADPPVAAVVFVQRSRHGRGPDCGRHMRSVPSIELNSDRDENETTIQT